MAQCYTSPSHKGPFEKCAICGKTVCPECGGRHLPTGEVWCWRCAGMDRAVNPQRHRAYYATAPVVDVPQPSHAFRTLSRTLGGASRGVSRTLRTVFGGLAAPFRDSRGAYDRHWGVDLTLATLEDKVWFGAILALIILCVTLIAIIYAQDAGVSFRQVLLTIALSCTAWAVAAVFLRYLFDRPLGRTASSIISYIIAAFLAIVVASLLLGI